MNNMPVTDLESDMWRTRNHTLYTWIASNLLGSSDTPYFNTRVSMTCSSNSFSTYHIESSIILCQEVYVVLVVLAGDSACSLVY